MVRILLALATIILIFWAFARWKALPPEQRKKSLLKAILIAIFAACVIAVFTGRLHWIGAVIAAAAALLKFGFSTILRSLPFLNILRRSPFLGEPQFKTAFLEVKIDLKSGQVFGNIMSGPQQGRALNDLSPEELSELERYYNEHDKKSYYLLQVIRQRNGHQYQANEQQQSYQSVGDPSVDEALHILGLQPGCDKKTVIKAHRHLMQKLHPDRGGNDYLASRVNTAKDILIQHIERS